MQPKVEREGEKGGVIKRRDRGINERERGRDKERGERG